jgi:hypothetical protein
MHMQLISASIPANQYHGFSSTYDPRLLQLALMLNFQQEHM